ncbi:MAG: hypothetical protein ABI589_08000 [Burkholderiales bacterium]
MLSASTANGRWPLAAGRLAGHRQNTCESCAFRLLIRLKVQPDFDPDNEPPRLRLRLNQQQEE